MDYLALSMQVLMSKSSRRLYDIYEPRYLKCIVYVMNPSATSTGLVSSKPK